MAIKSTLPNVKQPITDSSGYITKAFFDFLRTLWERTGGNEDIVSNLEDEVSVADLLIFRNRIKDLEKRLESLEKEFLSIGI